MKKLSLILGFVVGVTSCYMEKPNTDFLRYSENFEIYKYNDEIGVQATGIVENFSDEEKHITPRLRVWLKDEEEYSVNEGDLCTILITLRGKDDGVLHRVLSADVRDYIKAKEELFYTIKSDAFPENVEEAYRAKVEFE